MKRNLLMLMVLVCATLGLEVNAAGSTMAIAKPVFGENPVAVMRELPTSLQSLETRIVGGTQASVNEFPEYAALFIDGQDGFIYFLCGGTLLTTNKVLTAAHCTVGASANLFYVAPNFYSFDNLTFLDLIPVSAKVEHPDYEATAESENDASIVTLSQISNAPQANIYAGSDSLVGATATVIGLGLTSENGTTLPDILRKVDVPIVSNQVCQASYAAFGANAIQDNMVCAGFTAGGKDSCQGDSGGPLWVDINNQKTQVGIVSFGFGCARANFYGVYSRVNVLLDFIKQYASTANFITGNGFTISPILPLLLED